MLNRFREIFKPFLERVAGILVWLGAEPHEISLLGLVLACFSTYFFYRASSDAIYALYGLILFAISSLVDALDGVVARRLEKVNAQGAFLDSIIDRFVEVIITLDLVLGSMITVYPALLYLGSALLVSYTRARAEALGLDLSGIGFMERAERLICLMTGIFIWTLNPSLLDYILILVSGLNLLTILQRIHYTMKGLRERIQ